MNLSLNLTPRLQNIVLAHRDSSTRKFLIGIAGVLVLAIASQLSVPLIPVPLTFQSATVVLLGMAYGPRYGTYVMLAYLAAGICGVPVFSQLSAGPHVIVGPTGGYLLGFVPAAFISGYLAQAGFANNIWLSFIAACLGVAVIFATGLLQLSLFIGWHNAVLVGLMPFIASEAVKLIAVALMIPKLWKKS
jgi:biotin transport system substrate-specific component